MVMGLFAISRNLSLRTNELQGNRKRCFQRGSFQGAPFFQGVLSRAFSDLLIIDELILLTPEYDNIDNAS